MLSFNQSADMFSREWILLKAFINPYLTLDVYWKTQFQFIIKY